MVGQVGERLTVAAQVAPDWPVEAEHHLGVRSVREVLNGEELPQWQAEAHVQLDLAQHRERDGEDDRAMRRGGGGRAALECQLDPAGRRLAHSLELRPVTGLAAKARRQTRRDLLIAADDVIPLVAEDTEWRESRAPVGVDEQQEVQTALLVDLEAILDRVGDVDDRLDQGPGAARL